MYFKLSTPREHNAEVLLFRNVSNGRDVEEAMKRKQFSAALIDAIMVGYISLAEYTPVSFVVCSPFKA